MIDVSEKFRHEPGIYAIKPCLLKIRLFKLLLNVQKSIFRELKSIKKMGADRRYREDKETYRRLEKSMTILSQSLKKSELDLLSVFCG